MERKVCPLEIKMAGGEVSGFGAVFGTVDQGGDRIPPGAFAESLASGRKVRMLRDHDPSKVIGRWDELAEADGGLRVRGAFAATPLGQETATLVSEGALDGLSIGYRTVRASHEGGVRVLEEIELWEVSVVTFPMNAEARIDAVKALLDGRPEAIRALYEQAGLDAGLATAQAKAAALAAVDALSPNAKGIKEVAAALRERRKTAR